MKKFVFIASALFVTSALVTTGSAQEKQRLSPAASAEYKFSDGKTIKTDYSSPRVRGRKIFGAKDEKALVPYSEVWRTGANDATTFVTSANLTVGGKAVPAGAYTIFTIPNADAWTLIISKKTGEWGTEYPGEKEDLVRVPMKVSKTSAPVENFTIAYDKSGSKATLRIEWENTRATVEISE